MMIGLLMALAAALGLGALGGCGGGEPAGGLAERMGGNGGYMVNRIAYVDDGGDLRVIDPDGTGEVRLTGDVRAGLLAQALERGDSYSWPTWRGDGERLAASRVSIGGRDAGLSVQVFDLAAGRRASAYENEVPAAVADGAAHYIYWSPDGHYLTFLAPTPDGLALLARDYQTGGEAAVLAVGAPLYYHWGRGSGRLAVHSGERLMLLEASSVGFREYMEVEAVGFRAPALSPGGELVAYAASLGEVHGVFIRGAGGGGAASSGGPAARLITETRGMTALAWAPDGSGLAVSEAGPGSPVFQRLSVFPLDGSAAALVLEEEHLAFFWSPSGDRIAWVGVDANSRQMELWVSAAGGGSGSGDGRRLFRFSPTGEFFTYLSFFDQYAYSHSIWAPDGSALVVTGSQEAESGRRNGSGPSGGRVYVVDADSGEARRIASGGMAVWSWN